MQNTKKNVRMQNLLVQGGLSMSGPIIKGHLRAKFGKGTSIVHGQKAREKKSVKLKNKKYH